MHSCCFQSPLGPITICSHDGAITSLEFKASDSKDQTPELLQAVDELEAYFKGKLKDFSLKIKPEGTPFQLKVWKALQTIPYGTCVSYKDIAQLIGNPKAVRAVGGANNKNPISIIIPCHRVIGSDGKMVGYGSGIDKKIALLKLEGYSFLDKSI